MDWSGFETAVGGGMVGGVRPNEWMCEMEGEARAARSACFPVSPVAPRRIRVLFEVIE